MNRWPQVEFVYLEVDAVIEFHAYASRTGRSGGKSSTPQYGLGRSRAAIHELICRSNWDAPQVQGNVLVRAQRMHGTVPTLRHPNLNQGQQRGATTSYVGAHPSRTRSDGKTHKEKTLCRFPNGALWQPALPC
jgi:hypothetical protein